MSRETVIELADHVVREFFDIGKNPKVFNRHTIPFNPFTITYRYGIMQTEEQVLKSALEQLPDHLRKEWEKPQIGVKLKNYARKVIGSTVEISYSSKGDSGVVEVIGNLPTTPEGPSEKSTLFMFELRQLLPMPTVIKNHIAVDPEMFALQVCNLLGNVIHYIEAPKYEVESSERREVDFSKSKKKGKKSKKIYINKKIYRFSDVPKEKQERSPVTRHTEAWDVRGHWRTYKCGKRVWVRPYVKGNVEKLGEKKPYRITHLLKNE